MKSDIIIKKAESKDATTIETLANEIWTQHYLPIIGQSQTEYMLKKYQSKKAIALDIMDGGNYFLAFCDDIPCGYSAIKEREGIFLSKFYVKKEFRRKGIATKMMSLILSISKEKNAHRIWLTCNKHNIDSITVYEKLGFKCIDSVVMDIGQGFVMDDYVFEKILD